MSRPRKEGKRARGIQGRHGTLFILIPRPEDNTKVYWISTGLKDIPNNVATAMKMREQYLNSRRNCVMEPNILLADYIDLYLVSKRNIYNNTKDSYFYRAEHIKKYFNELPLRKLKQEDVEAFLDNLFIEFHLSARYVKDIKVLFAAIIEEAMKDGLIVNNPVKAVVINKSLAFEFSETEETDDDDDSFFSYKEAMRFLEIVRDHELYEVFYLTLFFGLRREEILGLRWSQVFLKQKMIRINHTVTKGRAVYRQNSTKSVSSKRTYPLTDEQVELFKRLKEKEAANKKLFGNKYVVNETDYVFKHLDGSLFYPDYFSKEFRKIIGRNPDLPQNITFHGLRTSCISILAYEGYDVKSIQNWVGHKNIETTYKYYVKIKEREAKEEISKKMISMFKPK